MALKRTSLTKQLIDKELRKFYDYVPPELIPQLEYALFPGKRLRGSLLMAFLSAYHNQNHPDGLAAAAAIEATHAFSLVHDDMPALDNACMRRNKPSFFKKFDEANALLVGDLLQYLAQTHLKKLPKLQNLLVEHSISMVLGQIKETNTPAKNLEELQITQDLKTGRLFQVAGAMAAAIMKADTETTTKITNCCLAYGRHLQWTDDINDVDEDAPGTNILHFIELSELRNMIKLNLEIARSHNSKVIANWEYSTNIIASMNTIIT